MRDRMVRDLGSKRLIDDYRLGIILRKDVAALCRPMAKLLAIKFVLKWHVFLLNNVGPITGRAGAALRSTEGNYTAGPVRCIGGLAGGRIADAIDEFSKQLMVRFGGRRCFKCRQ